jgi:hypothetical protein
MNAELITVGYWGIAVAVKHCLCPDGVRRRARLTADADTFFSIPATITVKGTTISGFVTGREGDDGERDYEFCVVQGRKHSDFFGPRCTCYGINIHDSTCPQWEDPRND